MSFVIIKSAVHKLNSNYCLKKLEEIIYVFMILLLFLFGHLSVSEAKEPSVHGKKTDWKHRTEYRS